MADPASLPYPDRDIEQALVTLKKGSQLIKYSRKGKPKLCPFRISKDETTLIWNSRGKERNLKLSSVSRIISGQRTPVFRRYLRPEKDYLSFSLIYNKGERSLDLICKDQAEVEVWFSGLKALTSGRQQLIQRANSELSDINFGGNILQKGYPVVVALEFTPSITPARASVDLRCPSNSLRSDVGSTRTNMQLRGGGGDGSRVSVSSTPSCSSGGSGQDDIESLGDVYLWGEVWSEVDLPDGSVIPFPAKTDVLAPKLLESNIVLDVQQIACGVGHIALVTRQGEVFTWGNESGGRLGHGVDRDFPLPRIVESLALNNVEFIACGEHHTCAIAASGDLYTWGDGTHNVGALGHGTDVSHWVPKIVGGPLEGLQVLSVACGAWHSALATTNGQLFTFGDGTYGVLGHGDRASVAFPREVLFLDGLKTVKVACGVWHTAGIVEVMNRTGGGGPTTSRKLFTWGDGEKYRLGHGSKDTYLVPHVVSSLFDYNFHQVACGHTMTIALTTSGHVFTMGSTTFGQLGNPNSDGKLPVLVQDKLVGEFVQEISCGSFHVAVLTSRSEVYTWGKGANGRLGHGDAEDRKTPTLVETLKDRLVKSVSCGSTFTACICIHKWVSGADQSLCTGCKQAFGFTRKRHNCYNCGLVHCHACSSKKALKAALAPTPGKPHRVCDACHAKLKAAETGNRNNANRKLAATRGSINTREYRREARPSKLIVSPLSDQLKYVDIMMGESGSRTSQVTSLPQQKDNNTPFPGSLSALQNALIKPVMSTGTPTPAPSPSPSPSPAPPANARSVSPYSRRPSPPRSNAPAFSKGVIDSLKKTNEHLNQEVPRLQNQVRSLQQRCDAQDGEIQNLLKETFILSKEGASRCAATTEIFVSIAGQLEELTEQLPPEVLDNDGFRAVRARAKAFLETLGKPGPSSFPVELDQIDAGGHLSHDGGSGSHETTSRLVNEVEKEISEHFEHGVWIISHQLRNGTKVFKRVKFSRRRFTTKQANEWWEANKDRVLSKFVLDASMT